MSSEMPGDTRHASEVARRAVIAGASVLAASAALVACGSSGKRSSENQGIARPAPAGPPAGEPGGGAGQRLASTSAIPVGGGMVFASKKVVVTQPTPGTFTAFSAICTHQGCTVNKVANGTIDCPCHGSRFAITDGSVVQGPASRPLAKRQVTVSGDAIVLE
ncbi:MAG: Rieske (2Fe-2S) protein [Pseudonocardiaceae bacterium]